MHFPEASPPYKIVTGSKLRKYIIGGANTLSQLGVPIVDIWKKNIILIDNDRNNFVQYNCTKLIRIIIRKEHPK
jgi:hypothetical protein